MYTKSGTLFDKNCQKLIFDMQLKIPLWVYKNSELSDAEITVYVGLKALAFSQSRGNVFHFTVSQMLYYLYGNIDTSRSCKNAVVEALNKFPVKKLSANDYLMDTKYFEDNDLFTIINYGDVYNILTTQGNNKYKLVKYMCYVIDSCNNRTCVGSNKHQWFADNVDISIISSIRYMQILEDLKIIYVKHETRLLQASDGSTYREPNSYSIYANKELVGKDMSKSSTKYKQSMRAKYNYLVKGKEYPDSVKDEIRKFVQEHNAAEKKKVEICSTYVPTYLTHTI